MSNSVNTENSQVNLSLVSWLVRLLLYSSVFASVFLPSYVATEFPVHCRSQHWISDRLCSPRVEARNNIGAINRAQRAYYLEQNKFADSFKYLGLGIQTEQGSYSYRIVQPMVPVQDLDGAVSLESNLPMIMTIAQCKIKDDSQNCSRSKNYLSVVYTVTTNTYVSGETEILTLDLLCEMKHKNPLPTTMPNLPTTISNLEEKSMLCPSGSRTLGE
jgi:type II secretory pathway pseudopilin PulG